MTVSEAGLKEDHDWVLTAVPSSRARDVPTHPSVYAIYLLPRSYWRELYTWQFENKGKQRADTA